MAKNSKLAKLPDYSKLLENRQFSDVTIIAGKTVIKAHKAVLAERSRVFSAMFQSEMVEGLSNTVRINDVDPKVVEELVNFLYTGRTENIKLFPTQLYWCSEKYEVKGLEEKCVEHMTNSLNVGNAAEYLMVANLFGKTALKKKIMVLVRGRIRSVMKSDWWRSLASDFGLVTELISSFPAKRSVPGSFNRLCESKLRNNSETVVNWWMKWDADKETDKSPEIQVEVGKSIYKMQFLYYQFSSRSELHVILKAQENDSSPSVQSEFRMCGPDPQNEIRADGKTMWIPQNDAKIREGVFFGNKKKVMTFHDVNFSSKLFFGSHLQFSSTLVTPGHHVPAPRDPILLVPEMYTVGTPGKFTDVQFSLGDVTYHAHRLVLAAASPFFLSFPCKPHALLTLQHISPQSFESALNYIYTGKLPDDANIKLLTCSYILQIKKLFNHCQCVLARKLNYRNVVSRLIAAHRLNATYLKTNAIKYITSNNKRTVRTSEWQNLSTHENLINEILNNLGS